MTHMNDITKFLVCFSCKQNYNSLIIMKINAIGQCVALDQLRNCFLCDRKQAENQKSPVIVKDLHNWVYGLCACEFSRFLYIIVILSHSSDCKNNELHFQVQESIGPSANLCKWRRHLLYFHPYHDTLCPVQKAAGEMSGLNHYMLRQLHLNDSCNGKIKKDQQISLFLSCSADSDTLLRSRRELKWVENFCKTLQGLLKLKRTHFHNSTFGIVSSSAKFLDRNYDFDCYISDKQSRNGKKEGNKKGKIFIHCCQVFGNQHI